ncbi:MAG TPA: hypothetical protein IAA56_03810 [Candidatus Galloscillospira excrementavium]|nr:hypothetical protein [Candidatus Galloscillospira excrementavium]
MTLEGLLERYGQAVTLHPAGEGAAVEVRAFVQPVRERGEGWRDTLPTPLGLRRRERLLYLGTAQPPEGGWAEYLGRAYDVQTARPIYVGERLSHWWAMLEPRDEEGEA